jgi:hypothetical protein
MATKQFDIKIGDKVRIGKETNFLTVKEVLPEDVQIGKNKVTIKRLYFAEKHQPEFDWRVKSVNSEQERREERGGGTNE